MAAASIGESKNDRIVNKDKLQVWASVAEVASAIAVLITLIFLIVGMRENTNALQAQTFQSLMSELNDWRSSLREHEQSGLLPRFREGVADSVSKDELLMIRLMMLELWGIYEASYFANQRGVLGVDEWGRFEAMICNERNNQSAPFWFTEFGQLKPFAEILTPSFSKYVADNCEESSPL